MAIFGYLIWLILCVTFTVGTLAAFVLNRAFGGGDKEFKYFAAFLILTCGALWYGAYSWFPFEVIVK